MLADRLRRTEALAIVAVAAGVALLVAGFVGFELARARQHADANVLALGALEIGTAIAEEILMAFLAATFEGGRHARRVAGIMDVERRGISREVARA